MSQSNFRNFSFVMVGRVISSGLQAMFYLIFAAMLDPAAYGNLSYIIALAGTVSIVSRFGLNQSVTVYQAKNESELSNNLNILSVITTITASLILLPFNIYAALLCFAISFFIMNIHNLMGLKKYKQYMTIDIVKGILIVSIPVFFYFILEIPGIVIGMSVSYLLCSFNFLKFSSFKKNIFKNFGINPKILLHNFGVDLSTHAPRFADKLIVFPILGYSATGIHQLNMQILFGLEMFPIALHSFLLSEESSGRKQNKIIILVIFASVLIAIGSFSLGPILIEEFFPKYVEGIPSLQILIFSIIPLTISAILYAKLQAKNSSLVGYTAVIRIGSLLIFLGILGHYYELIGLAIAVLLSVILNTIFLGIIYLNFSKKSS